MLGRQLLTLTFAMSYIVIITRSPAIVFLLALLRSTCYSTLPVGLKIWDLFGHTGHSQWSVSVGNSYVASKAAATLSPTLIRILLQSPNWTKSRTVTMPTRISHFSHQIKRVLGSLELKNVTFFIHSHSRSFRSNYFDRSHIGFVFSTPKKSYHPGRAPLENHRDISYSIQYNAHYHQTPFEC